MAKRNPTSELNHDNWDAEDEKEDAGRFKVADDAALKKREIRVAKRRTIGGEDKGTGGLFKGFTGFSGFASNSNNNNNGSTSNNALASFAFGQQQPSQSKNGSSQLSSNNNANHLSQLKALNQSVLKWISQHVAESPYCVLTPIFRDYEKHLTSIEQKYPYVDDGDDSTPAADSAANNANQASTNASTVSASSKNSITTSSSSNNAASVSFNFSASAKPTAAAGSSSSNVSPPKMNFAGDVSNFKFNAKPPAADGKESSSAANTGDNQQKSSSLFGFNFSTNNSGSGTTISIGSGSSGNAQPAFSLLGSGQQQQEQEQEEEYEPPKPEKREIKEAGAVYTKRCKLFYMSPETKQWCDKGVGNLHVKPTDTDGKAQLIIRADNTLGTILLNTLINKEMSLTVTKNNLNLACVPNPPLSGKSDEEPRIVPFLIKVKAQEDAKQLLSELDKLRNKDD